jgi:hypothetical protein
MKSKGFVVATSLLTSSIDVCVHCRKVRRLKTLTLKPTVRSLLSEIIEIEGLIVAHHTPNDYQDAFGAFGFNHLAK